MTPVTKFMMTTALGLTAPLVAQAQSPAPMAPVNTPWGVISEPHYPAKICATLTANLASTDGSLDAVDASGPTQPDQARIEKAIETCDHGAVKLVKSGGNDAFLSGPITLKSNVTLWLDAGVTLFASRDPKDYDNGPGDCGTANKTGKKSCTTLITADHTTGAAIMGEGRIDGRGGSLLLSGPNKGQRSWWDVAYQSKQGLTQHNFRLLQIGDSTNFTLYGVTFMNSPNFHIVSDNLTGFTAWGIKILSPSRVYTRPGYACPEGSTPDKRTPATCFTPETVKNTDGFDPGQSSNVLLAYSYISTGDDHVAIKAHGLTKMHNVVIAHNQFYYGHGMSLGSETDSGDENIRVTDLAMDGMDSPGNNGLRIKSDASRGGKVSGVVFENICMRNTRMPLVFDTAYADKTGSHYPDFADITVRNFHYTGSRKYGGGTAVFRGFTDTGHRLPVVIRLDNVVFDGPQPKITGSHDGQSDSALATHFTFGPGPVSFASLITTSDANDVTISHEVTEKAAPLACDAAFIPLKSVLPDSPF